MNLRKLRLKHNGNILQSYEAKEFENQLFPLTCDPTTRPILLLKIAEFEQCSSSSSSKKKNPALGWMFSFCDPTRIRTEDQELKRLLLYR